MVKDKKTKVERKVEKDLLYIIVFFGLLIVLFLVASAVFASLNTVTYNGVTFNKEKFGDIPVYRTSYMFRTPGTGQVINYNLFLRTNPLENPVQLFGDPVAYDKKDIFITFDTAGLGECEDFKIASPDLARFYSDNQFTVMSANMDFFEAEVNDQRYVTCEDFPGENVVQIFRGDGETSITVDGTCVDVSIGDDCKILEAIEKLKVHSYIDAQANR